MASGKDWYPSTLEGEREMYEAILANIDGVNVTLGADLNRVKRLKDIATAFVEYYDKLLLNRAAVKALGTGFGIVRSGKPGEDPMPVQPVFHNLSLPAGDYVGIEKEVREFRDYLTGLFEWSEEMGDQLKMNGAESLNKLGEDSAPALTIGKIQDNTVTVSALKGEADGFEFQYRKAGTEMWQPLQNSGAPETTLEIPLSVPGVAEKFELRAIYLKNFKRVGTWSPTYNVTVG